MNSDLEMMLRRLLELDFTVIPPLLDLLQERASNGIKPYQIEKLTSIIGRTLDNVTYAMKEEGNTEEEEKNKWADVRRYFTNDIREEFWDELIPIERVGLILSAMVEKEK